MKTTQKSTQEIPASFLNRMNVLLGDEYEAFLSSLYLPPITGLRINTLKLSIAEFINRSPWRLTPVPWCGSGFILDADQGATQTIQAGKHPFHHAGLYYLQEPSAMAAAEILAPQPGEKVLDLAAAPGGKTTHLAALMHNKGVLLANEIHPRRVRDLVENLERCGITNAVVTRERPERLADHFGEYFDRVLVDAPCSGEGMFRKGDTARQEWKPTQPRSCAIRQSAILDQAARLVRPGGWLVYTTCTFSPDENEGVIAKFLARCPEFDLANIQPVPGFSFARPEWVMLPKDDRLTRAVRIWPHLAQGEGHFIALMKKQGSTSSYQSHIGSKKRPISHKQIRSVPASDFSLLLDDFCRENLRFKFDQSRLVSSGTYVYLRPEIPLELSGLYTIQAGWRLGRIQKGRFIPAHSLAMGIRSEQARNTLSLADIDPLLMAYLAGESIPAIGENGWVLLCVDGFPVGWGKRVHHLIKNYYPHGLRWRGE